MPVAKPAFLFDLDGTLVDSVYDHVLAWHDALQAENIDLPVWRIHRRIGMSGGLFANMLLREVGQEISKERIDHLRRIHAESYARRSAKVRPLPGWIVYGSAIRRAWWSRASVATVAGRDPPPRPRSPAPSV